MALSGTTIPGQRGPGSDGNEGVLRIPQSSSIAGTSPSDCLVSYLGHSLGGLIPLKTRRRSILQPQPTGQLSLCVCVCVCVWARALEWFWVSLIVIFLLCVCMCVLEIFCVCVAVWF